MEQSEELQATFIEEYTSAELLRSISKLKSAVILLSKSLFALCDYLIFVKYNKLPKNHSERVRILETKEKEIYSTLDSAWSKYTDTYSKPSGEETYEMLHKSIQEIVKNERISEKIKEIVRK